MNARSQIAFTAVARPEFVRVMAEAEPMKVYLSWDEFNDDDVYLYIVATGKLVRQIPVNSPEVFCARYHGMKVLEGQSWARGRSARELKLWRSV